MDYESFLKGYATGVMLHNHLRRGALDGLNGLNGLHDKLPLASMSVTGIAADMEWFADLSGVETLTLLSADYSGNVTASYSYDGSDFTESVSMTELLAMNPAKLFANADTLYFRFHLADADANLNSFRIYGVPKGED